jgi:hypothetical protein
MRRRGCPHTTGRRKIRETAIEKTTLTRLHSRLAVTRYRYVVATFRKNLNGICGIERSNGLMLPVNSDTNLISGLFSVLCPNGCFHISAGIEITDHFHPAGTADFDQIVQNPVDRFFVKDILIPEFVDIEFQRF